MSRAASRAVSSSTGTWFSALAQPAHAPRSPRCPGSITSSTTRSTGAAVGLRESLERRLAALGALDAIALGLEVEREAAREVLLVLNQEDARVRRHDPEESG